MNIDDVLNPNPPSKAGAKAKTKALVAACVAVAEAIHMLGSIPSGELYARMMEHLNIDAYTAVIAHLKAAGLVAESNHLLTWIGPNIPNKETT